MAPGSLQVRAALLCAVQGCQCAGQKPPQCDLVLSLHIQDVLGLPLSFLLSPAHPLLPRDSTATAIVHVSPKIIIILGHNQF